MFVSLALHGLVLALFAASPPTPMAKAPEYIAVELIAAPPAGGRGPAKPPAAAKPAPAPPPPPAAEPAPPSPPPAPAPPAPKAPVQVLPEETPGRIRKVEPEPDVVAKVQPKPVEKPVPQAPPRPVEPSRRRAAEQEEAPSLEDVMAELEDELGGDPTRDLLKPQGSGAQSSDSAATASSRPGVKVSPEQLAWDLEVSRMIRARFPTLAQFRGLGLVARVEVVVSATGQLAGEPRLLGSSGDLDFDRIVIAVVERAAPLPPPPAPGARQLSLTSEER